MKIVLTLFKIMLFILALWVLYQNLNEYVDIAFLTYSFTNVALVMVILVALTAGAVLGTVFMAFHIIDANSEMKALRIKNSQLIAELQTLRNIAIDEIPEDDDVLPLPLPSSAFKMQTQDKIDG